MLANLTNGSNLTCPNVNDANFLNRITDVTLLIYPCVMIVFGTISNSITFIVLTRPRLRRSSTFFYLSCLSIIDLVLLYTFCINLIFYYHFNIDLQDTNLIFCKIYSFLIYFLPQLSAWTCVAVSLDRVIGVIFSVKGRYASAARKWNTPRKAFQVIFVIFLLLFLLNIQFFFYPNGSEFIDPEIKEKDVNLIYCSLENHPNLDSRKFYEIWVYLDLSMNVLIPFGIMIISSVIIVYGIFKSTKNLANTLSQETARPIEDRRCSYPQIRPKSTNSNNSQSDPLVKNRKSYNFIKRASTAFNTSFSSKARSVSYMLATNNIVFISLTLPIVVFLSVATPLDKIICDYEKYKMRLIKVMCIILMNSNCTVNIFIYSFMASEFRHQLFELIDALMTCILGPKANLITKKFSRKTDKKSIRHSSGDYHEIHSKRASSSK
ncbi:unnamed protein product [Brachionus calyciflorus]|uniref:G-protein coupled receptors family 1 profile domain-containing protein n=1 Tax=Brachionus calyciflorus TaxID=104777 RepID=A0A813M875_9BILA|nr:unnamed protein product [Brachionus calyciflorus]